jgi:hypothetical protein
MFILAYLVVIVLRANHFVVPHLIGLIVGILAFIEGAIYLLALLIAIARFIIELRNK